MQGFCTQQGLHALAAQGLHALAAQGLQGLHALAAQGLHALAAQGLQGLHALAAQGLHGLHGFACFLAIGFEIRSDAVVHPDAERSMPPLNSASVPVNSAV